MWAGCSAVGVTSKFSRAFADYKKNPKFIVPRLVEFFVDIAMFAGTAIVVILATLAFLPSLAIGNIRALLYGDIPFVVIALVILLGLILVILLTLVSAAASAAVISMAQETHASGTASLETGLRGARNFASGIFLFSVAMGMAFLILFAIALVPFALGSFFMGIFALLITGILALVFYLFAFFTPQFIVIRGNGVIAGIRDSVGFVESNFFSVIIYAAVVIAVSIGVALLTNALVILGALLENPLLAVALGIFQLILSIGLGLLISPYFDIVKTYMVMEV